MESNQEETRMKRAHWEIQYAKFFNFPSSSSTTTTSSSTSTLRPLSERRKKSLKGTWVSSSSCHVSLDICVPPPSLSQCSTLLVSLPPHLYEEHYVSTLNYIWPQGSCLSECSIKGSRVILASYRDGMGQIQKFAMRFSSSAECQKLMKVLKCLKAGEEVNWSSALLSSVFTQGIIRDHTLLQRPSINREHSLVPYSCSQQVVHSRAVEGTESTDAALPQSFTSLLADCFTVSEPGVLQAPEAVDLQNFLEEGSMVDKPFMDLLEKMDNIIVGLGGDLAF